MNPRKGTLLEIKCIAFCLPMRLGGRKSLRGRGPLYGEPPTPLLDIVSYFGARREMSIYKRHNYEENLLIIKQFGENKIRIIMLGSCRIAGLEDIKSSYQKKYTVNSEKLNCNLSRAKSRVFELAMCNKWDYWCTFTISQEKYNRYDLQTYFKHLSEFIHNQNKRRVSKIKYLFIPEMHKDGAWHIHGFISGIPDNEIIINRNGYKTWSKYQDRFGFMSMSEIKDIDKCSSYALKYMTKDISKNVTELGAHLYYASQKLNVAKVLYRGQGCMHGKWDWEHPDGYCKIKTIDNREQCIEEFVEVLE